jgi:preprotein translocase subunit SecD
MKLGRFHRPPRRHNCPKHVAAMLRWAAAGLRGLVLAAGLPLAAPDPVAHAEEITSLELNVASVSVITDYLGQEDNLAIELRLTEASGAAFGRFTKDHVGKRTQIVVGGVVVMEPMIMEPIGGGTLNVAGVFSTSEAERLAASLRQSKKLVVRLAP